MEVSGIVFFLLLVWSCAIAYAIGRQDGRRVERLERPEGYSDEVELKIMNRIGRNKNGDKKK